MWTGVAYMDVGKGREQERKLCRRFNGCRLDLPGFTTAMDGVSAGAAGSGSSKNLEGLSFGLLPASRQFRLPTTASGGSCIAFLSLTRLSVGISSSLFVGSLFGFFVFAVQKPACGTCGCTDCGSHAGIACHRTNYRSGCGTAQTSGYGALLSVRHAGATG
jgi:hypothetical protein